MKKIFAAVLVTAALVSPLSAATIAFGPPYTTTAGGTGDIRSQSSFLGATWGGTTGLFFVVDDGFGNQLMRSAPATASPAVGAFTSVSYSPTSQFFGGDTGPVTDGFTGILAYSFDLAVGTVGGFNGNAWTIQWADNAGTSFNGKPLELYIQGDGDLAFRNGAATTTITDAFSAADQSITISGQMNFGTQTFTMFINGVQQGGTYNFKEAGNGPMQLRIQSNLATNNASYFQLSVDNIALNVVPEPSVLFLALLGATVVIARRGPFRRK